MSLGLLTSRDAVLAAMAEFDELGREAFLERYGYGRAKSHFVEHDGRLYDSKAVAGVAVGYEHREPGPLRASEITGENEAHWHPRGSAPNRHRFTVSDSYSNHCPLSAVRAALSDACGGGARAPDRA